MSVRKRGDFWHYDFTISGIRYRGPTKQRSKAAALKVEARERERAVLGEVSRPIPTLKEAADRWFAANMDGRRSARDTSYRIEIALRYVGAYRLVSEIDTPDIEDAIQRRRLEATRRGSAPSNATVNRDLIDCTLRPILRYCAKKLRVPVQPIEWKDLRLKEPEGRSRTFTGEEIAAWRAELPEWHRPIFDFIGVYGVRLAEAFFPIDNFDAESGRIVLRKRKNGKPHAIRLLPGDARELAARLGRAKEAGLSTIWFRETRDGLEPITWRGFEAASRVALDRAGVADARPVHDLRHHAATAFLRLPGATMRHAQQLLGHETIQSTARYAHVTSDDVYEILWHASGTSGGSKDETIKEDNNLPAVRSGF